MNDNTSLDLTPEDTGALTQHLIELIKRGASMEQIAALKDPNANTPDEALRALIAGNARFYSGEPARVMVAPNERRAQIMSQTPFAVVLGCADSRVPVEIVFDCGPGDLFSIRVAGNIAGASALGSIEYAITHLKVHLVVVMGHEGCGAVAAAMRSDEENAREPENVRHLLRAIEPAVRNLPHIRDGKARMREAVVANIRHQLRVLNENPVVLEAVARDQVQVVGAFYEIGSGAVDFLEQE
jgi:carbonic anhydrase